MNIPRLPFVTCRFTLTGLNLERFMNTLQKEGVPLLSARRTEARTLECACYLRDLPRVRQLAGEKGWRVQRARPAQLAALWAALKKRPGALLGAALALAAAYLLTQTVWRLRGRRGWALHYRPWWPAALVGLFLVNCLARNVLWLGFGIPL